MASIRDRIPAGLTGFRRAKPQPNRPGLSASQAHRGGGRPRTSEPKPDHWQRGTALAAILSVALVGVGLVVTNNFNRDQLAQQQQSAHEQQDLALKGQRADRFVRAVEQLGQEGQDKLGVRLGGIYALEALMKEFSADENMVIEVLCAFVRTHAPWDSKTETIPDSMPDVRAALTVLGRRPDPVGHVDLDFSETNLGLTYFNLPGADFRRADLSVANFSDSKLPNADLRDTNLKNAFLDDTDLRKANFDGANMYSISLQDANLSQATLRNVNFDKADLTRADLTGADLTNTTPAAADERKAITTAQLKCAKLDATTKLPPDVIRPPADAWQQNPCRPKAGA